MTFLPLKSPVPDVIVGAPLPLCPPDLRVISVVKPPCYPFIHLSNGAFITVTISSILTSTDNLWWWWSP